MRDAAMSSIARVIFIVDWTERIRRRTTRSWAPIALRGLLRAGLADGACPLLGSVRALLEAVFDAARRAVIQIVLGRGHAIPAHVGLDLVRRGGLTQGGVG